MKTEAFLYKQDFILRNIKRILCKKTFLYLEEGIDLLDINYRLNKSSITQTLSEEKTVKMCKMII